MEINLNVYIHIPWGPPKWLSGEESTSQCKSHRSSDVFYDDTPDTDQWQKMGVLAVEMEAPALYMNAARSGARALCLCTISDSLVTGEVTTAEERQNNFTQMMDVAFGII